MAEYHFAKVGVVGSSPTSDSTSLCEVGTKHIAIRRILDEIHKRP